MGKGYVGRFQRVNVPEVGSKKMSVFNNNVYDNDDGGGIRKIPSNL